jgi:hopanoid biosynthesis associated RND transporter like protein HpnN
MDREPIRQRHATAVERLLTGLVTAVCWYPWPVLIVSLLVAALSVGFFCTNLEYRTQRSDLVNPNKESQRRWQQYLAEFGDDDDMVVVVQGRDEARMKAALDDVARHVRERDDLFDRLFYRVDLRPLKPRALLLLPTEEIAAIRANLERMGMLLEFGPVSWQGLSLGSLLAEGNLRAEHFAPGKPLSPADEQFVQQLDAVSQQAAAVLGDANQYRNPWRSLMPASPRREESGTPSLDEPQYFFSGDKELAFLLARPVKEEGSFTAARTSVEALGRIVARVRAFYPDLQMGLTGLPVLENDEMTASQADTKLASWLALSGVGVLYLVVFRSLRYPFLTVGTMIVGMAWAMGWLTLTVGHLNILSATFAIMLIGMGDYGVLWVTRYEQNRAAGADVVSALKKTAAGGGPSIFTAALATAIAFFAAMLADFQAMIELGFIAGSGVLLCALACFTVLPALLRIIDRREKPTSFRLLLSTRSTWLPWCAAKPRLVAGVCLALTAFLGLCACGISYDYNLLHLQARGLESVHWEHTLIDHTAGASWHAVSHTATPEEALALKARYEQLPGVSRVVEVASLVPPGQEAKLDQLRDIQHRLRRLPPRGEIIPHAAPDVEFLRRQIELQQGKLAGDGELPGPLVALRQALIALDERLAAGSSAVASATLQHFEERMAGDLVEDLYQLQDVASPIPITLADLPDSLRERYIGKHGRWLLCVFARECLWEHEPLERFVNEVGAVDPHVTGRPFGTLEGLRDLKNGFEWAGLYALGAIVVVFWLDFRIIRYTLLALVPLGMGVAMSLGVMTLAGMSLNPANMIAFPLILGVGAVYGVHVVHDYLARDRGKPYALSYMIGRAILVMALTNIISFGTLLISTHAGLSSLGLILALGVAFCMAAALLFLPAFLRGVRVEGRGTRRPDAERDRRGTKVAVPFVA